MHFTSRAHRTLELALHGHGHGMRSSFPSQPYNARYMPAPAAAFAVHACHGRATHNGHGVTLACTRQATGTRHYHPPPLQPRGGSPHLQHNTHAPRIPKAPGPVRLAMCRPGHAQSDFSPFCE